MKLLATVESNVLTDVFPTLFPPPAGPQFDAPPQNAIGVRVMGGHDRLPRHPPLAIRVQNVQFLHYTTLASFKDQVLARLPNGLVPPGAQLRWYVAVPQQAVYRELRNDQAHISIHDLQLLPGSAICVLEL